MTFNNPVEVREFVLAGKAIITLESLKTGAHFTYRINRAENRDGTPANRWFVSLMTGPDNESSYSYLGLLDHGIRDSGYLSPPGPVTFRRTAKSRIGEKSLSVRGFVYFWNAVCANIMPKSMVVRHEGRCGRCAHRLTVPESIDAGLGPYCRGEMGLSPLRRANGEIVTEIMEEAA